LCRFFKNLVKGIKIFLNLLNSQEKSAFLELAHHVSRSDKSFSESEKLVISTYCSEMQISDIDFDENSFDLETTLSKFQASESQKIILLEIMALIYADNILRDAEQKVLDTMLKKFGINQSMALVYGEWSKSMMALCIQGEALIRL